MVGTDFDLVIRNGWIIDGTGNPWFKAEIGVRSGKIAKITPLPLKNADRIVDAKGLIVCPGFINIHSHSDSTILAHNGAENCLAMGLVTELTGQCGESVAPISESYRQPVAERLKRRTLGISEEVDWLTLGEWRARLEGEGIGVNIAPLVGHGSVRSSVMGVEGEGGERIVPSHAEMAEMKSMVEEAMKEGAFGFSTGLIYAPGRNALTDEVVELLEVVAKYGGIYACHMRNEGDLLLEATEEFIETCQRAGIRGTIAHHKASGRNNYGKACETIRKVERARARGVDIIIDQYPWRHGGTTKSLGGMFKGLKLKDGTEITNREDLVEKLKDQDDWEMLKEAAMEMREKEHEKQRIRKQKLEEMGLWTSPFPSTLKGTILFSKSHPELIGKSYEDIAKALRKADIWEGIRALLIADQGYTSAGGEPFSEDDILTIMRYPWTTISTDQYAMDNSKVTLHTAADALSMQHPRGWGTYAKILGKYVRDEKALTIEDAIRKMTSLPAGFLSLQDRGLVKERFWADLVLFNPENVRCTATYGDPHLFPNGIQYVIVNGELAIDEGKPTGALAGKTLHLNS